MASFSCVAFETLAGLGRSIRRTCFCPNALVCPARTWTSSHGGFRAPEDSDEVKPAHGHVSGLCYALFAGLHAPKARRGESPLVDGRRCRSVAKASGHRRRTMGAGLCLLRSSSVELFLHLGGLKEIRKKVRKLPGTSCHGQAT